MIRPEHCQSTIRCKCRTCQLFLVLTLTAVPFWIMITTTSGFFGEYSVALGNDQRGVPFMQPYSFNNKHAEPSFLPALNFASILEDKGDNDLTSRMKFEGTEYMVGTDLGRDYFLLSEPFSALLCA